jgi:hypothetical protein
MEIKGSKLRFLSLFSIIIKFLIDIVPSCPYIRNLGLWPDVGQYGPMEIKGSKLRFLSSFNINKQTLIDRVPSCPTLEIWDFARIGE